MHLCQRIILPGRGAIQEAEVVLSDKVQLTSEELLDFVKDADALISGTDFIREDVVRKLPEQLKVISPSGSRI